MAPASSSLDGALLLTGSGARGTIRTAAATCAESAEPEGRREKLCRRLSWGAAGRKLVCQLPLKLEEPRERSSGIGGHTARTMPSPGTHFDLGHGETTPPHTLT